MALWLTNCRSQRFDVHGFFFANRRNKTARPEETLTMLTAVIVGEFRKSAWK